MAGSQRTDSASGSCPWRRLLGPESDGLSRPTARAWFTAVPGAFPRPLGLEQLKVSSPHSHLIKLPHVQVCVPCGHCQMPETGHLLGSTTVSQVCVTSGRRWSSVEGKPGLGDMLCSLLSSVASIYVTRKHCSHCIVPGGMSLLASAPQRDPLTLSCYPAGCDLDGV